MYQAVSAGDVQYTGVSSDKNEPAPEPRSSASTLLLVLVVLVLAFVCADLGLTVGMGGMIKKIESELSTTKVESFASSNGLDVVTEDNYCAGTNPGQ